MTKSDLSLLPTDDVRSALRETVENHLNSKECTITVSSASQAGENNFIGIVYRVSFSEDNDNSTDAKSSKLILKCAPTNQARREQFLSRSLFLREMYMYNVVLPHFRRFEQSKGVIVEKNGFMEYPLCYRTLDIEPSECLFLEDLSQRSFTMVDKSTEVVTVEHVYLVMRTLGKFHAISIALKDQRPKEFDELVSVLTEQFMRRDDKFFRMYFNKQAQSALDVATSDEDVFLRNKLIKLFEREALDITADCLEESAASLGSVITHGDAWMNNILAKNDSNGKPIEISLLDWQMSRHSSPIIDLVYYLFSCTTKELRDAHYDDFLRVYHESLSAHVKRLGSDPEQLFPLNMMHDHFRRYGKFGLIGGALMLLPIITSSDGHAVDMDELCEKIKEGENVDGGVFVSEESRQRFTKRLHDVIIDMVRLDYI